VAQLPSARLYSLTQTQRVPCLQASSVSSSGQAGVVVLEALEAGGEAPNTGGGHAPESGCDGRPSPHPLTAALTASKATINLMAGEGIFSAAFLCRRPLQGRDRTSLITAPVASAGAAAPQFAANRFE